MGKTQTDGSQDSLSRRQFMKGSMAVAASAVALSVVGCAPGTSTSSTDSKSTASHSEPVNLDEGGTWVSAACWHNCGGRCMNKVLVKDGAVIRQKTDDTHVDSDTYPQQRGCVRGKAQQQQCYGADRLLYPMKRKSWQPGGGSASNGAKRGIDEWERISWDEAISLSSQELKRIIDTYGNTAIFNRSSSNNNFVKALGGAVKSWETQSFGTYSFDTTPMGLPSRDLGNGNDRLDMKNAQYVVMWASNPSWSAAGTPTYYYEQAREAGVKFICIDPVYNATAQMLDAQWVPVRTGTDMALMFAIAYEMLRLDEAEGDIVDWDFLNNCTVGFDADHMPADASVDENLKDYIMGSYDSTPKTPEWAEAICGVPAATITDLARILGKNNKDMILHNYGFARCAGTENISQLLMALGAMGGHYGKSGHCCASCYHANCANAGAVLVKGGTAASPKIDDPLKLMPKTPEVYQIIKDGGGTYQDVGGYGGTWKAPEATTLGPIKAMLHIYEASLQTSVAQKLGIEAHRAVDFVLSFASFYTTNAQYSDIVLPLSTMWERVGGVTSSNREFVSCFSQVTDPMGESKSDQEIQTLLLQGLGIDPTVAFPTSETQQFFEQIAGSTVNDGMGNMVPLVTITDADIAEWKVDGTAQTGIIALKDFIEQGGYQFERKEGDGFGSIGYEAFVKDPAGSPLKTTSGKFEIYCQSRFNVFSILPYDNVEAYKPYPTYIEPPGVAGYAATFQDRKIGGTKGEYPFQLFNPHYLRRSHTVFDNCPWLRETWANPVFLNRTDAEGLGIADGDTVLVTSPYGKVLRNACLMDILIPGTVGIPHGAWVDPDEATGIDKAGSDNYLTGTDFSGFGVTGYNTNICKIEKYTGAALGADCDEPQRIVELA